MTKAKTHQKKKTTNCKDDIKNSPLHHSSFQSFAQDGFKFLSTYLKRPLPAFGSQRKTSIERLHVKPLNIDKKEYLQAKHGDNPCHLNGAVPSIPSEKKGQLPRDSPSHHWFPSSFETPDAMQAGYEREDLPLSKSHRNFVD